MKAIEIRLLGTFAVSLDGRPLRFPPQHRQLLALLSFRRSETLTRSHVSFCFWPDTSEETARRRLCVVLSKLRSIFEIQTGEALSLLVRYDQDSIGLSCQGIQRDVDIFESFTGEIRSYGEYGRYRSHLLGCRGDLLPELDLPGLECERERFAEKRRAFLLEMMRYAAASDMVVDALNWGELILELDPCDEIAVIEMIELWNKTGRRARAIKMFDRLRLNLQREHGIVPSAGVSERFASIITQGGADPAAIGRDERNAAPPHLA